MIEFENFIKESFQRSKPSKDEEREIAKLAPISKTFRMLNWKVRATIHASAQSFERRPGFEEKEWNTLHKRMINDIFDKDRPDGEYLYYSRSLKQGYVVAVNNGRREVRIITVLPKGRNNPKPGTDKIIVEGIEYNLENLEIIEVK